MPTRVHALLVVRPDGRVPADLHLRRTLAALAAQTRPVDRLTIIVVRGDREIGEIVAESGADEVVTSSRPLSYARAVDLVTPDGDAVWLLAQDTAPAPDALMRLDAALDASTAIAVAAPKLVRWDQPGRIVSLGETLTVDGRTVARGAGEHDQGQWDADIDVLGADVRGLLIRVDAWRTLHGLDDALAGADEGLDLSVRARLAGGRIVLAPEATLSVAGDGVAALPHDRVEGAALRIAFAERAAQLHRRLVYAPAWAVLLHWLCLVPLAVLRTAGHLLGKHPSRIAPEWAATASTVVGVGGVARARAGIRRTRTTSWKQLEPLRVRRRDLRRRLDDGGGAEIRSELHFFAGGGAWIVLALLAVSIAAFLPLLTWTALGGGALAPLRSTLRGLWEDAAFGPRALGWATTGPADPFAAVVAVLGSLWPGEPGRVLVVLWVLALPLAGLGGWFAATRVSDRAVVRGLGALVWAFAPTLLTALVDPRPTGVLVHLLLPWLFYAGAVAHRSWSGAGTASLLLAAIIACSPSLAPAFLVLWVVALALTVALRRSAVAHVAWTIVPTIVLFAPLGWARVRTGELWALLADPGVGTASAPAPSLLLAAGFPTADAAGWAALLDPTQLVWVVLAAAPLAVAAVLAPTTQHPLRGTVLLITALLGLATALAVAGVSISTTGSAAVPLWTGAALSVMWAGLSGAALVWFDALPGQRGIRTAAALVAGAVLVACALPPLSAMMRGTSTLTDGPASTLPAYVAAEGRADLSQATLVLTPHDAGFVAEVVWGGSATLGGQTTLRQARSAALAGDDELAEVTAQLVSASTGDGISRLADHGVAFIVLAPAPAGDEAGRARGLAASALLTQRGELETVGDTGKGELWRITIPVAERDASASESARAREIAAVQLSVLAVSLLLAAPTPSSRLFARRKSRVVGVVR